MGCADTVPFQPKPNTPFRLGQSRTLRAYRIFCPISRIPEFWNFSKLLEPGPRPARAVARSWRRCARSSRCGSPPCPSPSRRGCGQACSPSCAPRRPARRKKGRISRPGSSCHVPQAALLKLLFKRFCGAIKRVTEHWPPALRAGASRDQGAFERARCRRVYLAVVGGANSSERATKEPLLATSWLPKPGNQPARIVLEHRLQPPFLPP